MRRAGSLRARLTWPLICVMAAVGTLAGVAVYLDAVQEVGELFDFELRAVAQSFGWHPLAANEERPRRMPDDDIVVQVWSASGQRLYCSNEALAAPRPPGPGYATLKPPGHGHRMRSYAFATDDGLVQAAQLLRTQHRIAAEMALHLIAPLVIGLPVLALAIGWIVRRELQPVRALGQALAERTLDVLEPVPDADLPAELRPLVEGFNRTLRHLAESFSAQRAFVADAAHELRTPLAAVRLQAQALQRCPEGQERDAAMTTLTAGIERASRLVQQLLTLARQEHGAGMSATAGLLRADLAVRELLAGLAPLAADRGIELVLDCGEAVEMAIDGASLAALVGNLVDNALRYSPENGIVTVRLRRDSTRLRLVVADPGPGIPADQRQAAFGRFYRVPGSAGTGSGLGLAIVAAVVERCGGRVDMHNPAAGGFEVEVTLPG